MIYIQRESLQFNVFFSTLLCKVLVKFGNGRPLEKVGKQEEHPRYILWSPSANLRQIMDLLGSKQRTRREHASTTRIFALARLSNHKKHSQMLLLNSLDKRFGMNA